MGTAKTEREPRGARAGRARSEAPMWWFLDTLVIEHELNDAQDVFVFEQLLPEGASPPLHVHDGLDDSFYLLEGRMVVRRGDELFLAGPGSWVSVPRGTPHTFRVVDGSARMLLVHDDASYRDLVHDVGTPAARPALPEPSGGPGLQRLAQALVDHDSRVVGPSMSEDEARSVLLGDDPGAPH